MHQDCEPSELGSVSLFKELCRPVQEFSCRVGETETRDGSAQTAKGGTPASPTRPVCKVSCGLGEGDQEDFQTAGRSDHSFDDLSYAFTSLVL